MTRTSLVPIKLPLDPVQPLEAATKQYVDLLEAKGNSKGGQLIINGTGLLGNNTNFANSTFVPADRPPGTSGSFLAAVTASFTILCDQVIPVDVNKYYILGAWARETVPGLTGAHMYLGVQPLDIDGLGVSPQYYMYQANTLTTLAADLIPGATTIQLTSAANWNNAAGASTHLRGLIAWNYVDSSGFAWPVQTYSRNAWLDIYADGGISGNTITLRVPWAGPTIPAGTSVNNSSSGGTYGYFAWFGPSTPTAETWTYRDNQAIPMGGGMITTGVGFGGSVLGPSNKFPPGTAKVKLVFLCNRVTSSRTAIAGVSMTELVAAPPYTQADADARFVNIPGDTMTGELKVPKVTLRAAGSPGIQLGFGYSGSDNYQHQIWSQHNGSSTPGNTLVFKLWKVGDPLTAPTNNVLMLGGDLITAYYPVALPADPAQPLHAATKQYVDSKGGLTQAAADALYVNVAGDTMTGTLVGVGTDQVAGGNAPSIRVANAQNTPYIGLHSADLATRAGFLQGILTSPMSVLLAADAGNNLRLRAAAVDQITLGSDGNLTMNPSQARITAQTRIEGGVQGLLLCGSTGAYIGLYPGTVDNIGTRMGWMGFSSTALLGLVNETGTEIRINAAAAGGVINFYTAGAYQAKVDATGNIIVAKTATSLTSIGPELQSSGRVYAVTATGTSYNFIGNITNGVDNDVFCSWRRANVIIGSILMNGTAAVTYATTSDGRLKHELGEVTEDEAIGRIKAYRPIKYQWLLDPSGTPRTTGTPQGQIEWGMIAQETLDVNPVATSIGKGEPYQSEFQPWSFDYGRVTPEIIRAMQAMLRRIEELEARLP